jgi:hypothetical protein
VEVQGVVAAIETAGGQAEGEEAATTEAGVAWATTGEGAEAPATTTCRPWATIRVEEVARGTGAVFAMVMARVACRGDPAWMTPSSTQGWGIMEVAGTIMPSIPAHIHEGLIVEGHVEVVAAGITAYRGNLEAQGLGCRVGAQE